MENKDIFKVWAPSGAKWVDWVRPVPFIGICDKQNENAFYNFNIPNINYINNLRKDTAIIVDLLGIDSVEEGIALAKLGYRPIPIYNGTNEQAEAVATTDNHSIQNALLWGISELEKIKIENDASPAFLLDRNRMNSYKMNVSVFDNSWDIYDQDMPSADYFLKSGIDKIIVSSETIQRDLKKILYKYQKKGIEIFIANGNDEIKKVKIKKSYNR